MDKIYIVFGDTARTDGDNIQGIFTNRMRAEEFVKQAEDWSVDNSFHIEEHYIDD